jgi:hypothetical protein
VAEDDHQNISGREPVHKVMARTHASQTPEFKAKISRARREHAKKHPYPPNGDKMCSTCRAVKYYDIENKYASEFTIIRRKRADGSVAKRPYYECKVCRADRMREKRQAMDPEERRAQARAYWQRYMANPENAEKVRAYNREQDTIRRRARGVPYKGPWKKYRDMGDIKVPREPFAIWLQEQVEDGRPLTSIAVAVGVDESRFRAIVRGYSMKNGKQYPIKNVSLILIDRTLLACGYGPDDLAELYPPGAESAE